MSPTSMPEHRAAGRMTPSPVWSRCTLSQFHIAEGAGASEATAPVRICAESRRSSAVERGSLTGTAFSVSGIVPVARERLSSRGALGSGDDAQLYPGIAFP